MYDDRHNDRTAVRPPQKPLVYPGDATRRGYVPPSNPPPRQRSPRRLKRKRRKKVLGCLWRGTLALGLFALVFSCLLTVLYRIAPPPRTNILVLGIDARPGDGVITRTDTMMLVTVDPADLYVGVLSIPRDLYLEIPNYGFNRINTAHILGENAVVGGGPILAAETIEANFNIPIHRTVRLNFQAFVDIIDAAGGIDVDVENDIIDYAYPTLDYSTMVIEFDAGPQTLNGERALQFARTRHGDSDFARVRRQQQVVGGFVSKMLMPRNWWRVPGVYLAFANNVDTDFSLIDGLLLWPTLVWANTAGKVDFQIIDEQMAVGATASSGASVLQPQWSQINPLVEEMFR